MFEEFCKTMRLVGDEGKIEILHQGCSRVSSELCAGFLQVMHPLRHGWLDGERMFRHAREAVRRVSAFPRATKVQYTRESDRGQSQLILLGQATKMVGSKELSPA